jgi:uncharacterized repeat protein (TIGR01451 family)
MRYIFILLSVTVLLLSFPFLVHAAEPANGCQTIFGGGTSCLQTGSLTLDKKIRNPAKNQFVNHLGVNESRYAPEQTVVFQLSVKNTGSRAIENVIITDTFPQYVAFAKGPGEFDKSKNTLTFGINKIEAGQTRSITIEGKVAPAQSLPSGTVPVCVLNQARVEKDRNVSTDNTSFCLQTTGATAQPQQPGQTQPTTAPSPMPVYQAPGVTTSPRTGPEMLSLIGLIPAAAAGFYLRRKTS